MRDPVNSGRSSLTLRQRLSITLSIPLVALLIVAAYALSQFSEIHRSVDTIYRDRVIPLQNLKIIADDYAVNVIDAVNKANAGLTTAEEASRTIASAQEQIHKVWDNYLATELTTEEARLVRDAEQLFRVADQEVEQAQTLLDQLSGNVRGRLEEIDGPLYRSIDPISAKITELVNLQLTVAEAEYKASQDAYLNTKIATSVVIIVALVVSIFSATSIFLWLVSQIGGEPSEVLHATRQIADGHLMFEFHERPAAGSILEAVKRLRDTLYPVIEEVQANASRLSTLGLQLHRRSESAQPQVIRQQGETTQVATAMSEMSATVGEVARSAASAADASQNAEQEVEAGLSVVADAIHAIEALALHLNEAANSVVSVEHDSEEIGGILNVIGGIAKQTNLLALNAAIEAARAGEQGRGFAVVADEVRSLASRTHESTQQIQHMIERLRNNVAEVVSVMNKSVGSAQTSVELSGEAKGRLGNIRKSVSVINDMNAQIASAAEQQSVVADEIDRNLLTIRDIANEVSEGFMEISASENEIRKVSEALNVHTAYFKL